MGDYFKKYSEAILPVVSTGVLSFNRLTDKLSFLSGAILYGKKILSEDEIEEVIKNIDEVVFGLQETREKSKQAQSSLQKLSQSNRLRINHIIQLSVKISLTKLMSAQNYE